MVKRGRSTEDENLYMMAFSSRDHVEPSLNVRGVSVYDISKGAAVYIGTMEQNIESGRIRGDFPKGRFYGLGRRIRKALKSTDPKRTSDERLVDEISS